MSRPLHYSEPHNATLQRGYVVWRSVIERELRVGPGVSAPSGIKKLGKVFDCDRERTENVVKRKPIFPRHSDLEFHRFSPGVLPLT